LWNDLPSKAKSASEPFHKPFHDRRITILFCPRLSYGLRHDDH